MNCSVQSQDGSRLKDVYQQEAQRSRCKDRIACGRYWSVDKGQNFDTEMMETHIQSVLVISEQFMFSRVFFPCLVVAYLKRL